MSQSLLAPADAQPPFWIGIDVGGTNIKIGVVDEQGRTVGFTSIETEPERGPQDAARRMAEAIDRVLAERGIARDQVPRLGLATPGPMDIPRGMILHPGNLPAWHNTPMRDIVAEATGMPVTFENDANAAAFGEFWAGAARQYDSMVMITLGTGVGGGIIYGGMLISGAHSCGAEIGQNVLDPADDAESTTAGVRGGLEAYCGSYGVLRRMREALAASKLPSSLRDVQDNEERFTPLAISQAAEAGDELALGVILETAKLLAIGLVTAIHTIDPQSVVIGGAMTFGGAGHPLGERFLAEVREQTNSRILAALRGKIEIDFAQLGGNAGYVGAAGLARQDHARR